MKRTLSIFTAVAVLAMFSVPAFADLPKPIDQAIGGVKTVVMSPLEVRDHTMTEYKAPGFLPFKLAGGMLKGTFYMGKKIVDGTYAVVSSPFSILK